jgi:hypothetical protein
MFLSENLTEEIDKSSDAMLLEIYCGYQDEKRNSSMAIVKSFIWQLLRRHPRLWAHVSESYTMQSDFLSSIRALWRVFKAMIGDPSLKDVYCVIDGLDECHESSIGAFLKNIAALHGTHSDQNHLRTIILSRPIPEVIEENLSNFPKVDLDNNEEVRTNIEHDVDKLVEKAMMAIEEKHASLPSELRDAIERSLQAGGQGSFLWVGVVAEELRRVKLTKLLKTLESFPPTLEQLFSRIIDNISPDIRTDCARILQWVAFVEEPLTVAQLAVAIEIPIPPGTRQR